MGNYTGPILTYLALLGLILTTGIATFRTIKDTLGSQLSKVTHSVTATGRSSAAAHGDSMEEIYNQLRMGDTAQENRALADFSEKPLEGDRSDPDPASHLGSYLTALEHFGKKVSDKLSGDAP